MLNVLPPNMWFLYLPTEGAIEAIIIGPATQATGSSPEDMAGIAHSTGGRWEDEGWHSLHLTGVHLALREQSSFCHL